MGAVYRAGGGARVVVRDGRAGRRLEIDGTFASLWRHGRETTGSVWDALAVPLLALPPARRRTVLLLGLGAGSAARLVRRVAPRACIVGVEVDPAVVRAARRWFDLDALRVDVRCCDARDYLRRTRRRFDVVLEDVFIGSGRRVRKPDWMLRHGWRAAAARLARGGLLVTNVLDEAPAARLALRQRFPARVEITVEDYDNRILVGGPRRLSGAALRRRARAHPDLHTTLASLRFRTLRSEA